jgi:hypothetical protein
MSDNLRDHIATAIQAVDDWRGVTDPTILADAVIDTLGLQAQHLDRASCVGNKPAIRYVTEWTADE